MAVQTNCNPQSPNFCTPPAGSTLILTNTSQSLKSHGRTHGFFPYFSTCTV
jgi:hypothetical protein